MTTDSPSVTLRLAGLEDAAAVAELVVLLADAIGEKSSVTPEHVAGVVRRKELYVLLASDGRQVVGLASFSIHASLYHAGPVCLVDELIVRPESRNQGIGAQLLGEVVRRARQAGCAEVSLSVMITNTAALRFYQRHGFEADALLLERHFAEA